MSNWSIAICDKREDRVKDVLELLGRNALVCALIVVSKAKGYEYFAPSSIYRETDYGALYSDVVKGNWTGASYELQRSPHVWFLAVLSMIAERSEADARRRGFDLSEDGCLRALNRERAEAALASSEDERGDELADVALVCLTAIHLGYDRMPEWTDMTSTQYGRGYTRELVKALHGIGALGDFWLSTLSGKLRHNETRGTTLTP